MKLEISAKKKFIATVAVSFLLVSGLLGIWWWLVTNIQKAEFRLEEIRIKIAQLGEERMGARTTQSLLNERNADIVRIENFFADSAQPIDFIESLEGLGRTTHNKVVLDFDQNKSTGEYLFFRLALEGTAHDLLAYVALLELFPYEVRVEEFNFKKIEGGVADVASALSIHKLNVVILVRARTP